MMSRLGLRIAIHGKSRQSNGAGVGAVAKLTMRLCNLSSCQVLRWLYEEEAVDAAYLTASVMEYISSVEGAGLNVPPDLVCLAVDCMLEQGQVAQVRRVRAAAACRCMTLSSFGERFLREDGAAG